MLDITSLCHGDDAAIITDVKNTVLLEDRTEHVLHNHGRGRVRNEARLFVKLLGEEIDAEVTVLARLSRGGDADHLAGTALENQEIADADMVARNGDGVGSSTTFYEANTLADSLTDTGWAIFLIDDDLFTLGTMARMEWMENSIGGFLKAMTEGVIMPVVVVISHFGSRWWIDGSFGLDSNLFSRPCLATLGFEPDFLARFGGATAFVLDVESGLNASTVVTLGDVYFLFSARDFNINFSIYVTVN